VCLGSQPPFIPDGINHVGSYQTTFDLPPEWKDKRIYISFEGVSACFYLHLNGRKVGYSQDSRLPAEFDITSFCRPGANTVSVRAYRFCDGSYLEDQDQWWLSGIYRDVRVYAKPSKLLLWDYTIVTDLELANVTDQAVAATLRISATVLAPGPARYKAAEIEAGCRVFASLYGPHRLKPGCTHADPPADVATVLRGVELARAGSGAAEGDGQRFELSLERRLADVKPWSAEEPWLYTLVLTLEDGSGGGGVRTVVDCEAARVGFRTVRVEGERLLVNGAAPLMRGVNRHEHDMRRGKYTSREDMVRDIELMKQFNVNASRCCHYPNRTLWSVSGPPSHPPLRQPIPSSAPDLAWRSPLFSSCINGLDSWRYGPYGAGRKVVLVRTRGYTINGP
jgi:beta-galactosidase